MLSKTLKITAMSFFFAGCVILLSLPQACFAQTTGTYSYFLEKGRRAAEEHRYEDALVFFEAALAADPSNTELSNYINLIIRRMDELVENVNVEKNSDIEPSKSVEKTSDDRVGPESSISVQKQVPVSATQKKTSPIVKSYAESSQLHQLEMSEAKDASAVNGGMDAIVNDGKYQVLKLLLDDEAWALQPNTAIDLAFDTKIVIRSTEKIDRFLVIEPNVLRIEQTGSDEIVVTPKMLGKTFFHIWEPDRRWTFSVDIIYGSSVQRAAQAVEDVKQVSVEPFHLKYDVAYNTYFSGEDFGGLERDSYSERHWIGLYGPTPHGDFDSNVLLYKTNTESMEVVSYAAGLMDGKVGGFKDFDLRLFDTSKSFSPLTLPGRSFRGVLLEGTLMDEQFEYALLRGRDRSSFGDLSPGTQVDSRDSYVEGVQVSYVPQQNDKVTFNYARTTGEQRPESAADKTMSVEVKKQLSQEWDMKTEVGYSDDVYAGYLSALYQNEITEGNVSFRQIPTDYKTATGAPGGQGEVGLQANYATTTAERSFNTYVDIYRDRSNKNPSDPDALNFDFNSSLFLSLDQYLNWRGAVYVVHTPGLVSDQTDYRLFSGLSRFYSLPGGRNLTATLGSTFQQSRYDSNPSSDYDRVSLNPSLHFGLLNGLNAMIGYDLFYVKDKGNNDETSKPKAFIASLSYYRELSKKWSGSVSVYYRNEEDTEAEKSFLAGQDSLSRSLNLTFKPTQDISFYCDANLRDVWSEQSSSADYTEADLRFGMRSDWNLGVAWNPKGAVRGYVFKDLNGDGKRSDDEPGIAGVRVNVGKTDVITDDDGWYYADVAAESLRVGLDYETLPKGFVVQKLDREPIEIVNKYIHSVDIAVLSQSGIYGTVFVDANGNHILDKNEVFISDVNIILDDADVFMTDMRGSYFFNNIKEGEHKVSLDINTLPLEYIPAIKLDQDVTVTEGTTYILHFPVKSASQE